MVEAILQAGGRIQDLVRQIVLFSRRDSALPVQVSLVSEISQILNLLSTTLPANLSLTTHLLVAPTVLAARGSLHQVILNLLTNALHATEGTPDAQIEVSLDIVPRPSDELLLLEGDYAHLSIADNGPGMNADIQARAFDPFFTTKGPEKGSGMGLAIVHTIVTTAGGAVRLESLPGSGTTVHVYWPVFPR